MSIETTHASSSEIQRGISVQRRLTIGVILIVTAAIIWLGAFRFFDAISQKDPWLAYTVWRFRLLFAASTTISIVSAGIVLWHRLLPGRPLSALLIASIFAMLILPATSMSPRTRRELVSENRFYGFADTTKQYIAFSGSLIVGCVIASNRKRRTISEQKDAAELPSVLN